MIKVDNKEKENRIKKGQAVLRKNKKKSDEEDIDIAIKITQKNSKTKKNKEKFRLEKANKRKKIRRRIIAKIIIAITLIGFLVAGVIVCLTSPKFNITQIIVKGQTKISEVDIIKLSEIQTGTNIFKFINKKAKDKIKMNPYIKDVSIKKKYPSLVEIEVLERVEKYVIKTTEEDYCYISEDGYMLANSQNELKLLEIKGMQQEIALDNQITSENLKLLYNISVIESVADEYGIEKLITSIDITDNNNYHIYIKEKGKDVCFGNEENISTKIMYIASIMEKNEEVEGTIYVNGNFNDGYRPYFRKKI